jgi:uncharacterized protein (DUF1697 family)
MSSTSLRFFIIYTFILTTTLYGLSVKFIINDTRTFSAILKESKPPSQNISYRQCLLVFLHDNLLAEAVIVRYVLSSRHLYTKPVRK